MLHSALVYEVGVFYHVLSVPRYFHLLLHLHKHEVTYARIFLSPQSHGPLLLLQHVHLWLPLEDLLEDIWLFTRLGIFNTETTSASTALLESVNHHGTAFNSL